MIGTLVYEQSGLILPITSITLRAGATIFGADFTAGDSDVTLHLGGTLRVHGEDASVIVGPTKTDTTDCFVPAHQTLHIDQRVETVKGITNA